MIQVITMVLAQYLRTPFEQFTDKFILAMGFFQLFDKTDNKDIEELKCIEKWTTEETRVSLYKLDRAVNPTKGEFSQGQHSKRFERDVKGDTKKKEIKLTEDQMQQRLCIAIRRVHEIVMKYLKDYKIEMAMGDSGEEDKSVEAFLKE